MRRVAELAKWRLKRVLDYIDAHLDKPISLADAAAAAGLSRVRTLSFLREAGGRQFTLRAFSVQVLGGLELLGAAKSTSRSPHYTSTR